MSVFHASVLAADCAFYEGPCEYMSVPSLKGQYGIMAHHSNSIGAVVPGMLSFKVPGEQTQYVVVSEGLVKIENNEVLVLVDTAERPEEVEANRRKRAEEEAKEAALQKRSIQENRIAQAQLAMAVGRRRRKKHLDNM